ncbi:MAG: PIG-L deacetylase family protein [Aurantibacter sp.]
MKIVLCTSVFFISILSLQNGATAQSAQQGKTLLAVFAHPDDEMTVAPILVKYVNEGAKVHLVICTDGRYGTNDFSGLEAGDGLVTIRKEEMKCSAEKLGVELTHLNYHDQLKTGEGYDGHIPHTRGLIKELHEIVSEIKPDAIITWGPDGGSNHIDHRLVGASVTQVYLSKVWEKPIQLFYVAYPSDLLDDAEGKVLRGVDPKYINTRISYSKEDSERAIKAIACHKSQISPEGLKRIAAYREKLGMAVTLRQFVGPTASEDSIF